MDIALSIIIPVYNGDRFIDRCLKSVLNQTLKNIEVIIINDGSKDNSEEEILKYQKLDNRIKYISTKNNGVSRARNIGVSYAKGEYIGFVDIDDYIDIKMYEIMYNKAKKNNSQIVFCGHISVRKNGQLNEIPSPKELIINDKEAKEKEIYYAFINLTRPYLGMSCNKIYKREFIQSNALEFDSKRIIGEDFYFNLQAFTCASDITIIPNTLYYYNRIDESSTRKYIKDMIEMDIVNYKTRIEYLKKWDLFIPKNLSKINNIFVDSLFDCIRNEITENKTNYKTKIKNINEIIYRKDVIDILNHEFINSLNKQYQNKLNKVLNGEKNNYIYFYILFNLKRNIRSILESIIKISNKFNLEVQKKPPYIFRKKYN